MKTRISFQFWLLALCLWITNEGLSFADTVKVAVIADSSLANLADLATAQFSTFPELSVLERSDLDKIGHEQALKEVINSNDLSSVEFVPADGLVILRAVTQGGKTGIFARLVAVQPGIVLREVALSDGTNVTVQTDEIVKEFTPYWPKLAQIRNGKITALSLLGLRFELDSSENRELERKINILLASRLGTEPDTVVLERWRLNDALFEKTLNAQQVTPFWTGSSLIDGSMTWKDKTVGVSLRLRPPNGAEVAISDQDSADHLAALVERLADKIQAHPMTQSTWQPAAEAAHFAHLGKWCLDNRLNEQGAEAIESALALGDDSPATHRLQIRAYASLAYTDELPDAGSSFIPEAPLIAPESISARVRWARTAAELAIRYGNAHQNFSDAPGSEEDPVALSLPVLNNALRLLRFAYQSDFAWQHIDETADLRHTVQKLIAQTDQVLATRPSNQHSLFLTYQVRYAPYWHESPETTVAFYRDLLNRPNDGKIIRKEMFEWGYFALHPSVLLPAKELHGTGPLEHPDWNSASPRIISWEQQPESELDDIWNRFQGELSGSPDPVLQADALKFAITNVDFNFRNGDENGTRLVNLLQQNRDAICGPRGSDILTGFGMTFSDIVHSSDKTNRDALRVLGMALLQKQATLPIEWIKQMPDIYYKLPPTEAGMVLSRLEAYRQWYQTQVPQNPQLVEALNAAQRPLEAYAHTTPQNSSGSLTINRHWPMGSSPGQGLEAMRSMIFSPSLITAENKVWFVMFGGKEVHSIDPSNLQADAVFRIPNELLGNTEHAPGGCCLGLTPQYLVVGVFGKVLLCSRADNTWRALDLPPSDYKPCWIDQQLYLLYDVEADMVGDQAKGRDPATAISGLIHVSLPDGGIENLVSTRRIPPQSPLDGKPLGNPIDLWKSPLGLMLAIHASSTPFQVFGASPGKNDWALVASDPLPGDVKPGTGGELVGKGFDEHGFAQVVLRTGKDTEILLSSTMGDTARWNVPEDIRTVAPGVISQASAVMRGDDLCLYRNVMNATNDEFKTCLYYFAKGQKEGIRIPLKFPSPGSGNPMAARIQPVIYSFQSLHATDFGLVIGQAMGGFWVIPWSEIDAVRTHSESSDAVMKPQLNQAVPAPSAVATSAAPAISAPVPSTKPEEAIIAPATPLPVLRPAPVVLPSPIPAASADSRD